MELRESRARRRWRDWQMRGFLVDVEISRSYLGSFLVFCGCREFDGRLSADASLITEFIGNYFNLEAS